jgi:hypothetical protein
MSPTLRCTQLADLMQQLQTPFIASWIVYLSSPLMTWLPCELFSIASSFLSDWEEMASCEVAFAASMIYCGPMMRNAVPTFGSSDIIAPSIQEPV